MRPYLLATFFLAIPAQLSILLWLNNEDLRNFPLVERKLRLRHLIRASRNRSLLYASHMERHGVRLFQAICQQDCEGIVGKYQRGITRISLLHG